jgi:hypothetical protein
MHSLLTYSLAGFEHTILCSDAIPLRHAAKVFIFSKQPAAEESAYRQGCQMVCFQTKIPNLGNFWRALDW